jgi:hypothetical protein
LKFLSPLLDSLVSSLFDSIFVKGYLRFNLVEILFLVMVNVFLETYCFHLDLLDVELEISLLGYFGFDIFIDACILCELLIQQFSALVCKVTILFFVSCSSVHVAFEFEVVR